MTFSYSYTNQAPEIPWRQFTRRSTLPLTQQSLWKIEKGVVRTLAWLEDGTTITLGLWGPGDTIGKVLSKVETYRMECLTHVEVSVFSLSRTDRITEVLLTHIQQLEELMMIRSQKKMDIMLLNLLGWLARKFGCEVETGKLIDLRLTHQDIAEMLGATRVTVTRILNQLEHQGLIARLPLQRIVLREEDIWHYEI